MIIMDTRERAYKIEDYLKKQNVVLEKKPLIAGDYLVLGKDRGVLIERKTLMELIAEMNSGRIWKQLAKIKGFVSYTKEDKVFELDKIIMVEGSPSLISKRIRERIARQDIYKGSDEKSILGRIHTILINWGIPMIFTGNWFFSGIYLKWLDEYLGSERERRIHKWVETIPIDLPMPKQAIGVLSTITGIKTACAILEKYGNLKNVVMNLDNSTNFENIKIGNRRISSSVVKRLIDVFNVEAKEEARKILELAEKRKIKKGGGKRIG